MISQAIKTQINRVFLDYGVRRDTVVLLCCDSDLDKRFVKPLLEAVLAACEEGCVCVMGDCAFNTNAQDMDALLALSNQERLILAANDALQLLSLRDDSILVRHPSLSMGAVGKMARYLFRHTHLDFPYDKPSVFADLHDLGAFYLCVGDVSPKFALKHAFYGEKARIEKKEACVYNGEIMAYLDFECNFDAIDERFEDLPSSFYDAQGPLDLYGGWYPNLLSELRKP